MNDRPENIISEEDRDAIVSGLQQLKMRRLTIRYGQRDAAKTRIRSQMYFTDTEARAWKTLEVVCAMAVGRPVSKALVIRLALSRLLTSAGKSVSDPVEREKLKAEILALREERAREHV